MSLVKGLEGPPTINRVARIRPTLTALDALVDRTSLFRPQQHIRMPQPPHRLSQVSGSSTGINHPCRPLRNCYDTDGRRTRG